MSRMTSEHFRSASSQRLLAKPRIGARVDTPHTHLTRHVPSPLYESQRPVEKDGLLASDAQQDVTTRQALLMHF